MKILNHCIYVKSGLIKQVVFKKLYYPETNSLRKLKDRLMNFIRNFDDCSKKYSLEFEEFSK